MEAALEDAPVAAPEAKPEPAAAEAKADTKAEEPAAAEAAKAPKAAKEPAAAKEPKAAKEPEATPEAAKEGAALFTRPEGEPDDLKKISGVGPVLEGKLHELGITKFSQVAAFTADEIAKVDDALSFKGRIERDDWIGQAKALAEA